MSLTPEEYKRLASIASIYKPSQLRTKAEFYIKCLMFQHDCLMVDAINGLDDDFEKFWIPATALIRDRQQLTLVLELIDQVDFDYELASPEAVKSFLDECREEITRNSNKLTEMRLRLENLFKDSPNADHL